MKRFLILTLVLILASLSSPTFACGGCSHKPPPSDDVKLTEESLIDTMLRKMGLKFR
jgi:hypothetical protein